MMVEILKYLFLLKFSYVSEHYHHAVNTIMVVIVIIIELGFNSLLK